MKDRHLISPDEARAAGALDVPPAWRKSLSAGSAKPAERHLFSDLVDDVEDEETPVDEQEPLPDDADDDESADEPG